MINVQLNPERILMTELKTLHEVIMDIPVKRFGDAVREVFGGIPPNRDRKVYLCEFQTVFWPEYDLNHWLGSLLHRPSDYQYLPIETLKELTEQGELELLVRATRLLEKHSLRTPTQFVQLCTDFLQLFNLDFVIECTATYRQRSYSKRDLCEVLKPYLY